MTRCTPRSWPSPSRRARYEHERTLHPCGPYRTAAVAPGARRPPHRPWLRHAVPRLLRAVPDPAARARDHLQPVQHEPRAAGPRPLGRPAQLRRAVLRLLLLVGAVAHGAVHDRLDAAA